jgi:hypothetical protein
MPEDWMSVTSKVFRFEKPGDLLIGEIVSVRDGNYFRPNGTRSKIYDIRGEDGTTYTVFGSSILDRILSTFKVGDKVKIVYKGMTTTKQGRQVKDFEVFMKR